MEADTNADAGATTDAEAVVDLLLLLRMSL
jgi:hypothetical protein